jgi:hypothetical protein
MFFVRGLSSNGKEVFINPDQVLYVCTTGFLRSRTALVLAYNQRLILDQDTHTVRQRFEEYLKEVVETADDVEPSEEESIKAGQRSNLS